VRDVQLFLGLLARKVYSARLASGIRVLDASDFKMWLEELSDTAGRCSTMQEFFDSLP
jgi:hypothetical protein